jgi:hypothetical protein
MRSVIGTELIREMVETILFTGRVKHEDPVSLLLIAWPENGKTSIVLDKTSECAVDVTDATGRGIVEILKYKPDISHLIFNDLTAIGAHSKTVRAYTIAMINAMTEEGLRSIAFPGQVEVITNGKRGIIGCLTPEMLRDGRNWWNSIGLTTRMLPFFYRYSGELILKIKSAIDNGEKVIPTGTMKIPKIQIQVPIPEKESAAIRQMADQKSAELKDSTGIRRLKQLRRICQAHALRRTWKNPVVGKDEIDFLFRIYRHISYEQPSDIMLPVIEGKK